jgi:tRNA(Arg) A34 adenosine deaminase TadA
MENLTGNSMDFAQKELPMSDEKLFYRLLDVIEKDIAPLTAKAVEGGSRVFGAAVLRRKDLSLVLAETNHAAFSPLWHGEIYTIKLFYELQGHPDAGECIFLATHQPCCMCASALAWSGFGEIYYLFGYGETRDAFGMPHDIGMNRELFGCDEPRPQNAYFRWRSLKSVAADLTDKTKASVRIAEIAGIYARIAETAASAKSGFLS